MTKSHLNTTTRFGNRVEKYAKYRPTYPKEILKLIDTVLSKRSNPVIADIGSGTGIFSKLLLETGFQVYGIEPNFQMRSYADSDLLQYNNFLSIEGTAENTGLNSESVDLITAAQSFHWFDPKTAKEEFLRILKEDGYLLLIWNDRRIASEGFSFEYENFLKKECPEYNEVTHKNIDDKMINEFYVPNKVEKTVYNHHQTFNFEELTGRLSSSSYTPIDDEEKMGKILSGLKEIFDKYNKNGTIDFEYSTNAYMGKLK